MTLLSPFGTTITGTVLGGYRAEPVDKVRYYDLLAKQVGAHESRPQTLIMREYWLGYPGENPDEAGCTSAQAKEGLLAFWY